MSALRIGTGGSAVALAQTHTIVRAIAAKTGEEPQVVVTDTLRDALLAGECDAVVHALDHLPAAAYPGLVIGAVPKRVDARDALCARDALTLDTLPAGAKVGTGSARRAAQLRSRRPDLEVVDTRADVETCLGLVASGDLDAAILAAADLHWLGLLDSVTELFDLNGWPTAAGQGALGVEVRQGAEKSVSAINHPTSRLLVEAERQTLALLGVGSEAPVGVHALAEDGMLFLDARQYAADGSTFVTSSHALYVSDAKNPAGELAERVSTELRELGAR